MSSPFITNEPRAKILIWLMAFLFAGLFLYLNADSLIGKVSEYAEVAELTNPFEDNYTNIFTGDTDGDGLENSLEILLGGDISIVDTDSDGFTDYEEFLSGYDISGVSGVEYTQDDLDSYFSVFDNQFTGPLKIKELYYEKRIKGLLSEERGEEALNLLGRPGINLVIYQHVLNFYINNQDYNNALIAGEIQQKKYPEEKSIYFNLGFISQQLEKPEEAKKYYQAGEQLNSLEPALYNNLGVLLSTEGDIEAALSYFLIAIELDPEREAFYQNVIDSYKENNQEAEALDYEAKLEAIIDKKAISS